MKRIPLSPLFALAALPLLSASASTGVTPDEFVRSADLTDTFDGTVTGTGNDLNGFPPSNAFDNDTTTQAGRWLGVLEAEGALGFLRWDFADGPHVVRAYSFMSHVQTMTSRAPTAWTLEGSNDGGETWTTLDTVSGSTGWSQAETRLYRFENENAYVSYRWSFTARGNHGDQYFGLQEVELHETAVPVFSRAWGDRKDITETLDPSQETSGQSTDLTTAGGTVTASPVYSNQTGDKMFDRDWATAAGRWVAVPTVLGTMPDLADAFPGTVSGSSAHATFGVAGAFDNDVSTGNGRWLGSIQSDEVKAWVQWTFSGGPQTVAGYGMKNVMTGTADRAPRAWKLEGSDDGGSTWTLLDSVSGQGCWELGEERLFTFANATPFSAYRFSILQDGGSDFVGLQEIELYSAADVATNATGSAWVQWEASEAVVANEYALHSHPSNYPEVRCPVAWRLLASDDGATWTVLDRRTAQETWSAGETRRFAFGNGRAYRFWRFVVDGPGGNLDNADQVGYVGFSGLELFGVSSGSSGYVARVRSSPCYDNGDDRRCFASKAFDGDLTTADGEWIAYVQSVAEKAWLSYQFDHKVFVDGYGLAAYAHSDGRGTRQSPTAWTLYGSNDGGNTWTALDSRTTSAWSIGEKRIYDAASPGRYSLFKISITGTGSDGTYVGLQEIELYGSLSDGTVIVVK